MEKKGFPLSFGKEKMEEKQPEIPYQVKPTQNIMKMRNDISKIMFQPNSCDCGIFLLHYVELVFKVRKSFAKRAC